MADFLAVVAILAFLILGIAVCYLLDQGYRQV